MRALLSGFSFAILLYSIVFLTFCSEEKKELKKETVESSFLNIGSDVKYTGTSSCVKCHDEIHESYMHTGKGRAFHKVESNNIIEDFDNVHVYDSFSGYHYTSYWREEKMFVLEFRLNNRDTTYKREVEVEFVVGSGNQTRSYLFEENGYFYEIPITWYVSKEIWDLSPGYENGANTRFSRPISKMCMNCHNSGFEFVDNSVNRFLKVGDGIGCEKCHGPGELHVQKHEANEIIQDSIDYSIVNPAKLNLELQFDVCRQCHLEGVAVPKKSKDFTDFRPGMKLNDFWEVFIPVNQNSNDFGFASHVERLQMSKCFLVSDGKMNCMTCHDPHVAIQENPLSFYNSKCNNCHSNNACGEEHMTLKENNNNCVACHMPKDGTTDIPHVSSSDHFIRIVKEETSNTDLNGLKDFKNFTSEESRERDLFLANLDYYEKVDQDPEYLNRILKYIGDVERDKKIKYYYLSKKSIPKNLINGSPSEENNAYTAFYIGELLERKNENGVDWLRRAVDLAPYNLEFQIRLANSLFSKKRIDEAKIVYEKVLELNKLETSALVNLGFIRQIENNLLSALDLTKQALQVDPLHLRARENLINIYLNMGDFNEALQLLDKLIEDYPERSEYAQLKQQIENSTGI